MQPLIGVTAGEIVNFDYPWAPVSHGQSHTYVDAIVRAGGAPVTLPIVNDKTVLRKLYEQCEGLLLSGGNDLDPRNYSTKLSVKAKIRATSPKRDQQEAQLLKWALEDNKPVLGICRGMQVINVTLGGTLYADINAHLPKSQNHESSVSKQDFSHLAHQLKIDDGSLLAEILETDTATVNSLHHQALCEVGKGLIVTARAEDGVVEAIELPDKRFVLGIQSHPEALEAQTAKIWRKLFKAFVKSCQPG